MTYIPEPTNSPHKSKQEHGTSRPVVPNSTSPQHSAAATATSYRGYRRWLAMILPGTKVPSNIDGSVPMILEAQSPCLVTRFTRDVQMTGPIRNRFRQGWQKASICHFISRFCGSRGVVCHLLGIGHLRHKSWVLHHIWDLVCWLKIMEGFFLNPFPQNGTFLISMAHPDPTL